MHHTMSNQSKRSRKTLTERSTKNEILEAYHNLLAELGEDEVESLKDQEARTVAEAAASETVEKITTDLSSLKISLNQEITKLTEELTEEAQRLATLKRAIGIAQKELQDTQQVKIHAASLYRLIELKKQQEEALEKEMQTKRNAWEQAQQDYEQRIRRERARDEEEYSYQQSLNRKRDALELQEKRKAFEQEVTAKEEKQAALLKELEDLRIRAQQFPIDLEKAIKEAVGRKEAELKKEAATEAKLIAQRNEAQQALAQQKIDALTDLVKSQTAEITRLTQQLDEATRQVKDIAVSVIEGPRKEAQTEAKSSAGDSTK